MNNTASCTIVLPCYNPQPEWAERVIHQYELLSERLPTEVNIIIVNDGSTQNISQQDIASLEKAIPSFEYISYSENRGKGYALRQGVAKAISDVTIYTDIDFPYSINSVTDIYQQLQSEDVDIVAGVKNQNYYNKVPMVRRYISKVLRSMIAMFFNIPISDTQCGLKGFNQKGRVIFVETNIDRYLFDLEFIHNAHTKGLRIKAVEVELNDFVVFRRMNYKLLLPEVINFIKIIAKKR